MIKTPKIIFFDIETTPVINMRFQYDRSEYINHENIMQDWYICCAAWKELGSKKTHAVSMKKTGDDYHVVKTLRDALAKADIIAGHVIDRFDIRNLNARLIYHKLPPLPPIPTLDTFKLSKKIAGFTSNKLDYLSKFTGGGGKIHTDGQLWRDVVAGSKKALKDMVTYNKMDVIRNEEYYMELRPYIPSHIHVGVLKGEDRLNSCPKCGSTHFKRNGPRVTASGIKKQECQCQDCGGYFRLPMIKI